VTHLVESVGGVGPLAVIAGLTIALSPWAARWIRFERRLSRRMQTRPSNTRGWPYW
jgi:hypothetical protein